MTTKPAFDWLAKHPDVSSLQAALVDQNGSFRGKRYPIIQLEKLLKGNMRLPLSSCNVDVWGEDIENSKLVFKSGDADGICHWTGRDPLRITWNEMPSLMLPMWLFQENGDPFMGDPRQVLMHVISGYQSLGLKPVVATELEFYLMDASNKIPASPLSPVTGQALSSNSVYSLTELDHFDSFLNEVYETCAQQQIAVDAAIAENGAGQFEINLLHTSDPLKAADDATFFKRAVKGIARKHSFIASFMAKPYMDRSGNGFHVHFSLLDENGSNIFDNGTEQGSNTLHHAVAGVLNSMSDFTALFAPHLNSYRRLRPNSHAPTQVAWGYENRTTAVRIPGGDNQARRLEHRVAGADANPYLVLAAILAGALDGISKQLTPPDALSGDAYQSESASVPTTWRDAVNAFTRSPISKELLPTQFVDLYGDCKAQEIAVFENQITPFEYQTYLETV